MGKPPFSSSPPTVLPTAVCSCCHMSSQNKRNRLDGCSLLTLEVNVTKSSVQPEGSFSGTSRRWSITNSYITVCCVTLRVLVHGAGRGSHTTVPSWSHAHALHLSVARVIGHSLLVHGFHGLMKRHRISKGYSFTVLSV